MIAVIEDNSDSSDSERDELLAEINAMKETPRRVRFKGKYKSRRASPKRRPAREVNASEGTEDDDKYEQCVSGTEVSYVEETDETATADGDGRSGDAATGADMCTPAAARSGVYNMEDVDILDVLEGGVSFLDL